MIKHPIYFNDNLKYNKIQNLFHSISFFVTQLVFLQLSLITIDNKSKVRFNLNCDKI